MAQHQYLHLVSPITPRREGEQLQHHPHDQIPERQDHDRQHPRPRQPSPAQNRTSDPTTEFTSSTGSVGHLNLGISPDGRYVAMTLEEGDGFRVWDLLNRRESDTVAEPDAVSVRFSPDGRYLAAGSFNGRASLWRVGTWQRVWKADTGHNGPGSVVSFSPDGRILASSGRDSKIFLYDMSNGALIGRPLGPDSGYPLYAEFHSDRSEIVGYFGDGSLHRWDLDPSSWVRRACDIAGRDMTEDEWRRVLPDRPYQHVCPG